MGELLYNRRLEEPFLILSPNSESSTSSLHKILSNIFDSHEHVAESEPLGGCKLVKAMVSRLPLGDSRGTSSHRIYFLGSLLK